jgi:glycosyltransferase involved in cell wall biosynthesis
MRVLLISGVSSYMKGGVPVATRKLINKLSEAGHEPGFMADVPLPGAIPTPFFHLDCPQNDQMSAQMATAVEQFRPDVCHVLAAGVKMIAAAADLFAGRQWVLTVHSIPPAERRFAYFHDRNRLHYFFRDLRFLPNTLLWKRMFRRGGFARVICHSRHVLDIAARYGCDPSKLVHIPLGVDLPESTQPRALKPLSTGDGPKIVTVGGIAHTKGIHDFLHALSRLVRDFPNARYRIIGEVRDEHYLAMLQSLTERLGLKSHVSITRSASEEEKQQAVEEADLYVQPSHEEGFCLAYIEAAPIVPRLLGTDSGAIAAISAGLPAAKVVKPMDQSALEHAARQLLQEPVPVDVFTVRREFLGRSFSQEAYCDAHIQLYRSLT